jgi:hypothetical protein
MAGGSKPQQKPVHLKRDKTWRSAVASMATRPAALRSVPDDPHRHHDLPLQASAKEAEGGRARGAGGRHHETVELLSGIEGVSSRPVRRIVLLG